MTDKNPGGLYPNGDLARLLGGSWARQFQDMFRATDVLRKNFGAMEEIGRLADRMVMPNTAVTQMMAEGALAQSKVIADWQKVLNTSLVNQANQAVSLALARQIQYPTNLATMLNLQTAEWARAMAAVTRPSAAYLENFQHALSGIMKDFAPPGTAWPVIEEVRRQVTPIIKEIEEADDETLAALVEENLAAVEAEQKATPRQSRARRRALTPALTKAQLFLLGWLVVLIMSLPSFREFDHDYQETAAEASLAFAMSLAAGLTLWGMMEVRRDD